MNRTISIIFFLAVTSISVLAQRFVHVKPGIEQEKPKVGSYSITTVIITPLDEQTYQIEIPINSPYPHLPSKKQFYKIICTKTLDSEHLNFRQYLWEWAMRNDTINSVISQGVKESELPADFCEITCRDDVKDIQHLEMISTTNLTLQVSKNDICQTYICWDYPNRIQDGTHYYCVDLPEYYKQYQANQRLEPTPDGAAHP